MEQSSSRPSNLGFRMFTIIDRRFSLLLASLGILTLVISQAWAEPGVVPGPQPQTIRFEVFGRADSELSESARQYAEALGARTEGLEVVFHDVLSDREQLSRLWKLAKQAGRDKPVVPAFYCCGQMQFGFDSEEKNGADLENMFTADVYTRSTCPRCQSAKAFIRSTLQPEWPALRFRIYEITYDTAARNRYEELCRSRGKVPGLPTLHFAGQVIIGYQGDHITGAQWESLIRSVADRADVGER